MPNIALRRLFMPASAMIMKNDISSILDRLAEFQRRDHFSHAAWEARGLNPSDEGLSRDLRSFFQDGAKELGHAVQAGQSQRKMKAMLLEGLGQLNKMQYDTEEREFIVDVFLELASIIGVNIRNDLSRWLYGGLLTALLAAGRFLRPERVVETRSQPCTKCGVALETKILQKKAGLPDGQWLVIRCNQCAEPNLLSLGPDVKKTRFGNYQWIDSLRKDEFTREQALIRVEQIKYFRK